MVLHLSPLNGGISTRHSPRTWFDSEHPLDAWLLMYFHTPFCFGVLDGRSEMLCGGTGGVGDCLLHPPGRRVTHGPAESVRSGFVNDWIYFSGGDAAGLVQELSLPVNTAFHLSDASLIGTGIRAALSEPTETGLGRLSAALDLAGILAAAARQLSRPEPAPADPVFLTLSRLRTVMFARSSESWTVERLAALSGYSKSHFLALYRKYFGDSPMAELSRIRIERANNLLMDSRDSIGAIAAACGFSSIQYFSRVYRAVVRHSPSRTRRQQEA